MNNSNLTSTFAAYFEYCAAEPNHTLSIQTIAPALWGAYNSSVAGDIDSYDILTTMKEDFERITIFLQDEHKRMYVEEQHRQGKRDNEQTIGPHSMNVYEASQDIGCSTEAIRKAIRSGRLKAFVPKGQSSYLITDTDWNNYKDRKKRRRA